jgi:hypothetical protein
MNTLEPTRVHAAAERACTDRATAVQTWADAAQLKPVALAWLSMPDEEVSRLMTGVCSRERWEERPTSSAFIAASASEVVRIFNASRR